MKHSPLPWKWHKSNDLIHYHVRDATGVLVAKCFAESDASLIVLACNRFNDIGVLLAKLEEPE